MENFSHLIYGYEKKVRTSYGRRRYINLDNAASTPPFHSVMNKVNEWAGWYASVHRGAGYKSRHSTKAYESAREIIGKFVGADLQHDVVIFTKNTTDSINKLSHYLPYLPGEWVVYTRIEHHSNELPWQKGPHYCLNLKNGTLDLSELESFLSEHRGNVKLVAVSGASNVTGYQPPIYTIAEMAHRYGAKILVDGAQLVPHRPVHQHSPGHPSHLDFLAFSGHKMYAPFGTGVLIGPRDLFTHGNPSQVGGGTVKGIGPDGIIWSNPPENEEAGSPNVLGAIAMATACETMTRVGWKKWVDHEQKLIDYTLNLLRAIPEITIYQPGNGERVGVISFNVDGYYHQEVADFLSDDYGIGVRSGCFCARRYVLELLGIDISKMNDPFFIAKPPGMVRISFGCYNDYSEVDVLVEGIQKLIQKKRAAYNGISSKSSLSSPG